MGLLETIIPTQFKQNYTQNPETATLELAEVSAKLHLGYILRTLNHI